jgi:chromosome segregation ATPase
MKTLTLALALLLTGCSAERSSPSQALESVQPKPASQVAPEASQVLPAAVRMVIRTAEMSIVVDNAADYLSSVVRVVEAQGGYITGTRQWRDNGQLRASATLRVPAEKLTVVLEEIRKGAIRVSSESVTGQDVSEEYADLGAQLTNLRVTENELRQLLTTVRERTQKASEVLEVYKELSHVRGEIERLQGRVDYLKQMTAMSTINLEIIPDQLSQPIIEPGWRPLAIARDAVRSLVVALKVLGVILIWLVIFVLPLLAFFSILVLLAGKLWKAIAERRRRRAPSAPSQAR